MVEIEPQNASVALGVLFYFGALIYFIIASCVCIYKSSSTVGKQVAPVVLSSLSFLPILFTLSRQIAYLLTQASQIKIHYTIFSLVVTATFLWMLIVDVTNVVLFLKTRRSKSNSQAIMALNVIALILQIIIFCFVLVYSTSFLTMNI